MAERISKPPTLDMQEATADMQEVAALGETFLAKNISERS
jgi:hypothetical protein